MADTQWELDEEAAPANTPTKAPVSAPATPATTQTPSTKWEADPEQLAAERASLLKEGQRAAMEEPTFKVLADTAKKSAIPIAAAIASGGASIPAQAAISAGATALNQLLGIEEPSMGEMAKSGALPLVGGAINQGIRAVRGLGSGLSKVVTPASSREALVEEAVQKLGIGRGQPVPIDSAVRASTPAASQAVYGAASKVGRVPTGEMTNAIDDAFFEIAKDPNVSPAALAYLSNISKRFTQNPTLPYDDVMRQVQLLRSEAKGAFQAGEHTRGMAMEEASSKLMGALDKASPLAKRANDLYRHEQAVKETVGVLRGANPSAAIRELYETNSMVGGSIPRETKDLIYKIGDSLQTITRTGSNAGVTANILANAAEPVAQMINNPTGRKFLKLFLVDNNKPSGAVLASALQFWRAYSATAGQQEEPVK